MLESRTDAAGTSHRAVELRRDGGLTLTGHDIGAQVEDFFGGAEYEFVRRLSAAETVRLREHLGLAVHADLLTAIARRFEGSHALETFLGEHGIEGELSSHVGD